MKPSQSTSSLLLCTAASLVAAHSHVTNVIVNGDAYEGFDPRGTNPDILSAWSTEVVEDGWVGVDEYNSSNIICHVNATNSLGYASVKGGDKLSWSWAGWPESHKGPVVTYMARCGANSEECASASMLDLEFFQISRDGLLDPNRRATDHSAAMGYWASDLLIDRNYTWLVEVPSILSPGFYVMRHELIALHYAEVPGQGPQHYPQCVTVEVASEGSAIPKGVPGTELYDASEVGLTGYDIFKEELEPYVIPGPELMDGVSGTLKQTPSPILEHVEATPITEGARS